MIVLYIFIHNPFTQKKSLVQSGAIKAKSVVAHVITL